MCGIYGEVRTRGGGFASSVVECSRSRCRSRGPDAAGFFAQGPFALGHRRLSILDLAPASQQPMIDNELGLASCSMVAFTTFANCAQSSQAKGYRFFSEGDTEVILKAYHAWGTTCVDRFKGMFAFAISERDSGRVFIARDRLGIKPLYYAEGTDFFRFASTLPALLAAGSVDTSIDPIALHYFFSFHAAVPAPRTILNGVKKLAPGTWTIIERDGSRRN